MNEVNKEAVPNPGCSVRMDATYTYRFILLDRSVKPWIIRSFRSTSHKHSPSILVHYDNAYKPCACACSVLHGESNRGQASPRACSVVMTPCSSAACNVGVGTPCLLLVIVRVRRYRCDQTSANCNGP